MRTSIAKSRRSCSVGPDQRAGGPCHMREALGVGRAVAPLNAVSVLPVAGRPPDRSFSGGSRPRNCDIRSISEGGRDSGTPPWSMSASSWSARRSAPGRVGIEPERHRTEPGMPSERLDGVDDRGRERAPPVAVGSVDEDDLAVDLVQHVLEEDVAVREVRVERRCAGSPLAARRRGARPRPTPRSRMSRAVA